MPRGGATGRFTRTGWRPHSLAVLIAVAVLILWAGAMLTVMRDAALPGTASGTVMAVFAPGMSSEANLAAVIKAGGRPVRVLWPGNVWIVNGTSEGFVERLHRHGAIAAYGELPMGPVLAGCFAYVDSQLPTQRRVLIKP